MTYKEQLASPHWQKKRLDILNRDKWTCQICLDTEEQLQVHHKQYDKGLMAWEHGDDRLTTLCKTCHAALSAHIKEHGNDKEFDVIKIVSPEGVVAKFIYSKGFLSFGQEVKGLTENTTHKVVQFLINNWLKNE